MAVFNVNVTTDPFEGDSGAGGVQGVVPAPAAGDAAANKYLSADGTWKVAPLGGAALRTGSAIAFDVPAVYNSPTSPSSGTVTVDLTGAVAGTEVVACFNHSAEPTWPSGVTAVGVWNNSQLNVVRFLYRDASNISAAIVSDAAASYTNPEVIKLVTADVATTGTTATAIPDLSLNILAGRTYAVVLNLKVTGTATGGVRLGLYSVESDVVIALRGTANSTTSTTVNQMSLSALNAINTGATASNSASTFGYIQMAGTIVGGAVDSVVDLRFASALAGQNATVYEVGSFMKITIV